MSLINNYNSIVSSIKSSENINRLKPNSVKLLAVSKTVNSYKIRELYSLGQRDFAENRPQVLRDKIKELNDLNINWHFIGRLQSNKIKYVYPYAALVHSIDRTELLNEFAKFAAKTGRICPCLLEARISGEETKQGFEADEILDVIKRYASNQYLDIKGMMGMAPLNADEGTTRKCFRNLRNLFEQSKSLEGIAYHAKFLSMGMSGDYKIAIEEGSNIVRIGTALFSE